MRIAVLIIGAPLALLVFLQGCTGSAFEQAADSDDPVGGWGMLVGLAFLVASALVVSFPTASTVVFGVSALTAFLVAAGTDYGDMWVWGTIAVVLGTMSFFGRRGKRKADERADAQAALIQHATAIIAGAAPQPVSPVAPIVGSTQTVQCPRCHEDVPVSVRFCPNCGLSRSVPSA